MTFLNKIIIGILSALLIASLVANFMLYKGLQINIDKSITTHQHQEQFQYQGQLLINQWAAQGNTIEWKIIFSKDIAGTSLHQALNRLHPISALYSKITVAENEFFIIYPEIFTKTEKNKE